jgi:hypothetical protein
MLATAPIDRLSYLFFALESLLGDTGEGFTHPSTTYWLYEKVRSAAVHGSEPPDVSEKDIGIFAWDVRKALDEYLRYGELQDHTRPPE